MDNLYIGIDTSCYTTSVACINCGSIVFDERTMLSVPCGERGLRQSDILFQHNRNLPALIDRLFETINPGDVRGIGVSRTPTGEPESYMPAFLAGILAAKAISGAGRFPLYEGTHQQMHVRAAMFGNEFLQDRERFLAFHVSGGTTDLLTVAMENGRIGEIRKIGTSTDLHAGQFVDRAGVLLGCAFPCGPHLEKLAVDSARRDVKVPSSVCGTDCSFSGAESMIRRIAEGEKPEEIAYAVYDCLARTLSKMILAAADRTGCREVLLAGGVSSSVLLRNMIAERLSGKVSLYSGVPALSKDNAVGIALAAEDMLCRKN